MPETMPNFIFAAFLDLSCSLYQVGLAHDVVTIKYGPRLVAGNRHGHTLGDASAKD